MSKSILGEILCICPYCERDVSVYQAYCYDDETGKWFHLACFENWRADEHYFGRKKWLGKK